MRECLKSVESGIWNHFSIVYPVFKFRLKNTVKLIFWIIYLTHIFICVLTCDNIQEIYILSAQCIYVFRMTFRTNNDYL
jgi:hypothetical protein